MALKDTWKQTGKDLGHAFRDLGKAVVKTVKVGADKVDQWANAPEETEQAQPCEKKRVPENEE